MIIFIILPSLAILELIIENWLHKDIYWVPYFLYGSSILVASFYYVSITGLEIGFITCASGAVILCVVSFKIRAIGIKETEDRDKKKKKGSE